MNSDRAPEREGRRLTRECRSFLRLGLDDRAATEPMLGEHVEACEFCSARRAAKVRLAASLSRPVPPPPPQLHSAAFLDEIRARIVVASEQAAVGRLLAAGMPVAAPSAVAEAWPADLLESDLGRRTMAIPDPAGGPTWASVKASVLEEIAGHRVHRLRKQSVLRNRGLTLAGVAVAAIICTWLVSEEAPSSPEIVITDVATRPNIGYSPMTVLRYGDHR